MSSDYPPSGSDSPEYLDLGSGRPLAPNTDGGGRRTAAVVAAALGFVAVLSVGAWAAWSFLATGPQPAEALPGSTIAYASIDLDPSGGQKIEALQTLQKFPAFEDEIGLDTDDDIRKWIFDEAQESGACEDLDYADDIEPWLGDRFAVAAVDAGGDTPDPVFVVQVKDEGDADAGLEKLFACSGDEEGAWAISDGWALVAQTQEIADQVSDDAADGSLADDDDFTHWTDEAGASGIATMYLAPEAGELLADQLDELTGLGLLDEVAYPAGAECDAPCMGYSATAGQMPDELTEQLEDFGGMAATIRFADGSLEIEVAADAGDRASVFEGAGGAGDLVGGLPEDTAAAIGIGLADGWFGELADPELLEQLESLSGLDLPDDAETLLGEAAVLAISSDFDPEGLFEDDSEDVPVGLKVRGDAAAIEDLIGGLQSGIEDELPLGVDSDGDLVAIGPDPDYREQLLEDGDLGGSDVFRDAVPDADDADMIMFVSFDAGEWLDQLADSDEELAENMRPLAGFGMSGRIDGETSHLVLRVTTD